MVHSHVLWQRLLVEHALELLLLPSLSFRRVQHLLVGWRSDDIKGEGI